MQVLLLFSFHLMHFTMEFNSMSNKEYICHKMQMKMQLFIIFPNVESTSSVKNALISIKTGEFDQGN